MTTSEKTVRVNMCRCSKCGYEEPRQAAVRADEACPRCGRGGNGRFDRWISVPEGTKTIEANGHPTAIR